MHTALRIGQTVGVRTRTWLVEDLEPSVVAPKVAHLACIDDDDQGQRLQVLWAQELDAKVLDKIAWAQIDSRGFDSPERFGAYLRTLRWERIVKQLDLGVSRKKAHRPSVPLWGLCARSCSRHRTA